MDRRIFIKYAGVGLAVSSLNTNAAISPALLPFDAWTEIQKLRINFTSYSGAYIIARNGMLNWYMNNKALLPFASKYPEAVRVYIELYMNNISSTSYNITDRVFSNFDSNGFVSAISVPSLPTNQSSRDSDDAYAGTFLTLACRYIRFLQGSSNRSLPSWLTSSRLNLLKGIAFYNIANLQNSVLTPEYKYGALTKALQDGPTTGQYLMDNCEVYRGLKDFSDLLTDLGDGDSTYYKNIADKIRIGVDYLYQTNLPQSGAFRPDITKVAAGVEFYSSCASQVFPEVFKVFETDSSMTYINQATDKYNLAWNYLNYHFGGLFGKKWIDCNVDDKPGASIKYPWMIVGYAAAIRGDKYNSIVQMNKMTQIYNEIYIETGVGKSSITINEMGYYQRAKDALGL